MKSFGLTVATIGLVIALGAGGYFAVTHLSDPAAYVASDTANIGDLYVVQTTEPADNPVTPMPVPTPVTSPVPADDATSNDLSSRIDALIAQKVTLKVGSKGANVGTIQEFMNLYCKKNSKIDNDFGKVLEGNVKTFQTQNKITATGQIGPQTLAKMKDWLAKN